jgi:hypothetical protein
MRTPILFSVVAVGLVLAACGGNNETAQSPDAERAAEKASDSAEKSADKADKAADKADDAASDANKAEKESESK